ncbi:hypothetical protein GSI_13682 [Ganoderma sinense ZZ0214-1]|uniref:F-box domain-containing protein n=1 Tax=Ganoderma sinense ZZ0214-1 TaxID=1077348 RepID=A0A2G8RR14_9APHY|nr:hypothetical protein GSI_13682 [Ganoderma sinense ZZ0214-1]
MPPRKKAKAKDTKSTANASPSKQSTDTASRRKAVRGRRGGLKDMPNMPLDVLLEIFGFMHPRDLLNLARTNKSFRAFLMSKNAQFLWKASLENVDGLPKCPSYMNEPTYVNLLFFNHCHNCLKNNVRVVLFHCSARYCPACRKTMFEDDFQYRKLFKEITSDAGEYPTWFCSFTDSSTLLLHKPEIAAFEARWKGLDSEAAKKDLVRECKDKRKLIDDASQEFYSWESQQKAKRSDELDEIRAGRLEAIRGRLREAGWEKELDFIDENPYSRFDLERQKFATRSEPLTERVWQKIEKDVIVFIESVQTQRLANERKALLHERFSAFAEALGRYQGLDAKRDRESDFDPQLKDLIMMHEFRTILDGPDSADMSALDDDDKMRTMLDTYRGKWQEDRRKELRDMLQESVDSSLNSTGLLALVQALFRCLKCRRDGLRYPEVLAHECPRKFSWRWIIGWGSGNVEDVYQHAVATYKHHYRPAWSGERCITASTQAITYTRSILEACGLNPDTVTPEEADECGARLICRKCEGESDTYSDFSDDDPDSGFKRNNFTVYNWSRALAHCVEWSVSWSFLSFAGIDHEWERVSDEEAEAVRNFEEELSTRADVVQHDRYRHNCAYCEYIGSWQGMPDHLSNRHNRTVTMAQLADHCYIRADTVVKVPSIVLKREDDGSFHVKEREDDNEDDALGMFYSDYDEWSDELDAAFFA